MKPSRILRTTLFLAGVIGSAAPAPPPLPAPFAEQLNANYPAIETLYQDLHRNPELGLRRTPTAAKLAERAKALGFEVTTGVGGTGVVAILKNGPGPTVMLRTEMDALPVQEKTGLPFASKVDDEERRRRDRAGGARLRPRPAHVGLVRHRQADGREPQGLAAAP